MLLYARLTGYALGDMLDCTSYAHALADAYGLSNVGDALAQLHNAWAWVQSVLLAL